MKKFILAAVLGWMHLIDVYLIKFLKPIFVSKSTAFANEILVVHLSVALGDEIWVMGFVKHLQALKPKELITLVISPKFEGFIRANTQNVNIVPYSFAGDKTLGLVFRLYSVFKFASSLGKQFATTISPRVQDDQYAAFICYALSNGLRYGFDQNSTPNRGKYCRGINLLFTNITKPKSMECHTLENVQEILKAINPNASVLAQPWLGQKQDAYKQKKQSTKTVVLSISSGHSLLKKWPVNSFCKLIESMHDQSQSRIDFIMIGDKSDKADSMEIMSSVRSAISIKSLVAMHTLQEVLDFMGQADLYIGADTGLLHMANASGIACVGIFGSSCIHQFSPYLKTNSTVITKNLPCAPCNTGHLIDRCSTCIYSEPKCMSELSHLAVARVALSHLQGDNLAAKVIYAD